MGGGKRKTKRYAIEPMGGRRHGGITITVERFKEIAAAKKKLVVATGLEEKFHILLENYADFERALLDLALRHLIFSTAGWFEFQDEILAINRRLANLLSAARSYFDQVDHETPSAVDGPICPAMCAPVVPPISRRCARWPLSARSHCRVTVSSNEEFPRPWQPPPNDVSRRRKSVASAAAAITMPFRT